MDSLYNTKVTVTREVTVTLPCYCATLSKWREREGERSGESSSEATIIMGVPLAGPFCPFFGRTSIRLLFDLQWESV